MPKGEPAGGRRWFLIVAIAFGVAIAVFAVFQQASLGDFRRIEQDYIAARQVTACANQALLPLAFGEVDDLDAALEAIVTAASVEIKLVREEFEDGGGVFPFPPVRSAHRSVDLTLAEQVVLYDAMVGDPENSEDELERFTKTYKAAERELDRARGILLVSQGKGWGRRTVCSSAPPEAPSPAP